uniref:Uncharacterized protein n=1 Tax=Octopus bimaculoides TaxID=37653 RepID=A0A0L8HAG8_OCTBM
MLKYLSSSVRDILVKTLLLLLFVVVCLSSPRLNQLMFSCKNISCLLLFEAIKHHVNSLPSILQIRTFCFFTKNRLSGDFVVNGLQWR